MRHLGIALLVLAATSTSASADFIYGIADNNHIYEVNTATQAVLDVFDAVPYIGNGQSNAFAYDTSRDQMQFIGPNNATASLGLYSWNRAQNSITQIATKAQLGISTTQPANAAFYNDSYWFFSEASNTLNQISLTYDGGGLPQFGSRTTYTIAGAPTSANTFGDIAIDLDTGLLYAATVAGAFYSVDLSVPTNIASSFTSIKASGNPSLQLSFNATHDTLYGQFYNTGQWYTIDPTTGNATAISGFLAPIPGTTAGLRDLGGAAFVSAVPEPGTLGVAVLGGLLALISRRRRSR